MPPPLLSSPLKIKTLPSPSFTTLISPLKSHPSFVSPDSGAGDNNLCSWFYDTFQSSKPQLQLVVLRFLPTIVGLYLSRVPLKKPLAGFEMVLLALFAHETTSRAGQAIAVNVPDLSYSSTYHETKDQLERIAML
ncbi:hypothetical protein OIU77_020698 [Salix suchowensis]|uniref:Hyccin n=1 Tax=Salix suchowensis TaxID=1278906 RepID=A0ABQ9CA76_9ROSI|nr:hypothetical protein OIU77_020698 [Salix suchowensis]